MIYERDIIIRENPLHLAEVGAEIFINIANNSIKLRKCFNVAISGGATPRIMYRLLATEHLSERMPWLDTNVFWVDERCVPYDDENSNYGAVREDLISKVPIIQSHFHPMSVDTIPEEGAKQYRDLLDKFFHIKTGEFPVFDLIFLGIGTDGHTASLFPGQTSLKEKECTIVAVNGGDPNVPRLTMTYPVINNAKSIVLIVSGEGKAEVVRTIIEEGDTNLPASRVIPIHGRLIWLLDVDAAALLSRRHNHE